MSDYVIPSPLRPSLPVKGVSGRFPVRRIYCIGRNYADHAIEMGHDPEKEPPFFFQKNAENIDKNGFFLGNHHVDLRKEIDYFGQVLERIFKK